MVSQEERAEAIIEQIKKAKKGSSATQQKRLRMLVYTDSAHCATGFGQIAKNILMGCYFSGKFDIIQLGINYWGDPHDYPFPIYPMGINNQGDPYGREKAKHMILNMDYDILFLSQDSFILQMLRDLVPEMRKRGKKAPIVAYFPVDGIPRTEWIEGVSHADVCVTYSKWGFEQACNAYPFIENKLRIIPLGFNQRHFFPIENKRETEEFKRAFFGRISERFIFTNVNRNQQRKDIPRTIMAFKKVKELRPNTAMYLHMAMVDQGWDLMQVCKSLGLDYTSDVVFPHNFNVNVGFPIEVVNRIYNASDAIVSAALGEGWGYSWMEAMATKTPVIYPDNTAITENLTDGRGLLVKSGEDWDHHVIISQDYEVLRPLTNLEDLVDKMIYCIDHPEEMEKMTERAYQWVQQYSWDKIMPQWLSLFDEVIQTNTTEPMLQADLL